MKTLAALLVCTLCFSGLLIADDKTKDISLEGTWKAVKAERNGKPFDRIVGDKLVFKGKSLTIVSKKEEKGTFKLDTSKKPIHIDIMPEDGNEKTVKGIVELKGKTLTICFAQPGNERPTKFESTQGVAKVTLEKE